MQGTQIITNVLEVQQVSTLAHFIAIRQQFNNYYSDTSFIYRNCTTNPKKWPLWDKKHMSHMKLRSNCGGANMNQYMSTFAQLWKRKLMYWLTKKSSWLVIHATHSVTHTPFCLFQINVGFQEDYKLFLALMLQKNHFLALKFSLK